MTQEIPTIFESFNARNLAPEQVAQTFVAPDHFRQLIGQHHTLILGPRGSGKTTLLKMLQQEALDAWHGPSSEELRNQVGYYSIYVGTDVSWAKQIGNLGDGGLDQRTKDLLAVAAFTTQVLIQLTKTMIYVSGERGLNGDRESIVASAVAETWKLGPASSLLGVKYSLGNRLVDIHAFASKESILGEKGRSERIADRDFLHCALLACCSGAVTVFNDAIGKPDKRWAFLLDELELAPKSIRNYLLESLRSVDDRFLFKLSLAPFGKDVKIFGDLLSAAPGQDFELIPLWYSYKADGTTFCQSLWYAMLAARGLPKKAPEEVLGESVFDTDSDQWTDRGTAYVSKGKLAARFERLAKVDPSFRRFLKEKGINVKNWDDMPARLRASTVRKATSIVAVREALVEEYEEDGPRMRTRKSTDLYVGAGAIFAITEANPRWFKGMIGPLLDGLSAEDMEITPTAQNASVKRTVRRFRALLRTIPGPSGMQRGLLPMLDAIGDFFHEALVKEDFTPDPPGTLTVDSRTNDALADALGKALNAGALVSMESTEVPWTSLKGSRLRLGYILSPHYKILIRLERAVSLGGILEGRGQRRLFGGD